jgi:hypothetical protein
MCAIDSLVIEKTATGVAATAAHHPTIGRHIMALRTTPSILDLPFVSRSSIPPSGSGAHTPAISGRVCPFSLTRDPWPGGSKYA